MTPGALLSQRFAADLARQIGPEGRPLLSAFRSEGLGASLAIAEHAVNGHPLVVDGADRLLPVASSLDDPAATLWQDEKQAILDWLRGRVDHSPTFLVGRRHPQGVEPIFAHAAPQDKSIRVGQADSGYLIWEQLARIANNNPAVLTLARALAPLVSVTAFGELVEQASEDEATVFVMLQRLGQAFQASAPPSWQRVLSVLAALGEAPRDVVESLWNGRVNQGAGTRDALQVLLQDSTSPEEELAALERLREIGLIEERSGGLALLSSLADAGAVRSLTRKEREELLPQVAHRLLAPINDPRSLAPAHADRVLKAHAIFVELGDVGSAERTATLHVHGLVDLARRTSLNERYRESWQQYDGLLRLMQSGALGTNERAGRRLFSYVRHYRSRDGARAGALDDATCLGEYQLALAEWPENALWNQRVIEALLRLGRPVEAVDAVACAYEKVDPHPRRDELLRVRPASTALSFGFPLLSLDLIQPILDSPEDLSPEISDGCTRILRRWEKGLSLADLPFHPDAGAAEGCVVFHSPLEIQMRNHNDAWVAQLRALASEGRADKPRAAIEGLARHLASETRRLVSTPSSELSDKDVRLKGRVLSAVDVVNSDIGLDHAAQRWILGRIVDRALVPTLRHLPPIQVPDPLFPESTEGLYLARVPVYRDGAPAGPATDLAPAGSGRDLPSLRELLAQMSEEAP